MQKDPYVQQAPERIEKAAKAVGEASDIPGYIRCGNYEDAFRAIGRIRQAAEALYDEANLLLSEDPKMDWQERDRIRAMASVRP